MPVGLEYDSTLYNENLIYGKKKLLLLVAFDMIEQVWLFGL